MGTSKSPVGVMMVNFGVPAGTSQAEVSSFLRSYATDDRVVGKLAMTIRNLLHPKRFKESLDIAAHRFAEIADESGEFPYNKICTSLRRKVAAQLQHLGAENVVTIVAYRYGVRAMARGFKHLRKQGCRHILVLPLYPQSSYRFTASVHDEYRRARRKASRGVEFRFVDNFYDDPGYIRAMVNRIRDNVGLDKLANAKFVFAFRSTPLRDVAHGDTYELQTSASALAIANDLGLDRKRWTIAYIPYDQMGKRAGLEPTIRDVVDRFAMGHVNDVVVVCPGQVTDSVDTLFEVAHRMRSQFEHAFERDGESCEFTYVPALNDSDDFAYALADIIYANIYGWEDHFAQPSMRRMQSAAGRGASSGSGSLSGSRSGSGAGSLSGSGAGLRAGSGALSPSTSDSGSLSPSRSGSGAIPPSATGATGARTPSTAHPNATGSHQAASINPNTTGSHQAAVTNPNASGERMAAAASSDPNATGPISGSGGNPNATGSRPATSASPNATGERMAAVASVDPNATGPISGSGGNPNATGSRPAADPNNSSDATS